MLSQSKDESKFFPVAVKVIHNHQLTLKIFKSFQSRFNVFHCDERQVSQFDLDLMIKEEAHKYGLKPVSASGYSIINDLILIILYYEI